MAAADWLARLELAEVRFCLRANRSCEWPPNLMLFSAASRLGDGIFWYGLMAILPLLYGTAGLDTSVRMAVAGLLGTAVYRLLKDRLARERPYNLHPRIRAGARALDRYSFPSGHTLHAVSFTLIVVTALPAMAWLLVPLAVLIAMSRVILGLHYPSDVIAGALLGALLARLVLAVLG
ncbi:phosphatase PAP2 family protein [Wenzhouxiangella sp. XN24]|uniref:phosphatase PAP2 family protein n=1 Tax=Wenzhouxiangella sp. XN24 TaxID=2713569 RepID=UPI0013EBD459|nr:phosphatase PAP2 family protein [Wenzhouxiangella sp. XN24]NGX15743.1 phosphatase PAP2 family protein [Wenzhouxiangella sp. XN24]